MVLFVAFAKTKTLEFHRKSKIILQQALQVITENESIDSEVIMTKKCLENAKNDLKNCMIWVYKKSLCGIINIQVNNI